MAVGIPGIHHTVSLSTILSIGTTIISTDGMTLGIMTPGITADSTTLGIGDIHITATDTFIINMPTAINLAPDRHTRPDCTVTPITVHAQATTAV